MARSVIPILIGVGLMVSTPSRLDAAQPRPTTNTGSAAAGAPTRPGPEESWWQRQAVHAGGAWAAIALVVAAAAVFGGRFWRRCRASADAAHRANDALFIKSYIFDIGISANSIADREGRLTEVNAAFLETWGYATREEVIGRPIAGFLQDHELAERIVRQLDAEGRCEVEYTAVRKDGSTFVAFGLATILRDRAGRPIGYQSAVTDITERKRAEERLNESMQRLQTIVTGAPIVLYSFDRHGVFTLSEGKGLVGLGLRPGEIVGRTVEEVYGSQPNAMAALRRALAGETFSVELSFPAGGTFEVSHVAMKDEAGRYTGTIGVLMDITERKSTEKALQVSEDLLRRSQMVARIGSYYFDIGAGTWISSKVLDDLFGIDSGYPRTVQGWLELVHPEDREMMMKYLLEDVVRDRNRFDKEYRIRRRQDGAELWVHGLGELEFDDRGQPVRMIGTIQDISVRRQSEEALRTSLQEKTVLLREVHHRVKNNLQIVSSLLNLQADKERREPVLAALRDTQNRVRSMALLHEMLYRSETFAHVDFGQYLEALCAHLCRALGADPSRVGLDCRTASVALGLDQAVSCGLIVNELVSNALKHAFPDQRPGRVTVELKHDAERRLQLVVADDGVGLAPGLEAGESPTLGLQLVQILCHQLHASLAVDRTRGTAFRVTFPSR